MADLTLVGTDGNDALMGGADNDSISGLVGADILTGGAGRDTLVGGAGDDLIDGQSGSDNLSGDEGSDKIFGSEGADTIIGGAGNDTLDGGAVLDRSFYSDGNTLSYDSSPAAIVMSLATGVVRDGFGGTDTVSNFQFVIGSGFNDVLTGSSGLVFEMFEGGLGNDTIDGGAITDIVNLTNSNRVNYVFAPSGVTVSLAAGTALGGAGNDVLININQVRGSAYADVLTGSDRTDVREEFEGRQGNDTIDGAGGEDRVRYDTSPAAVSVNLVTGIAQDGYGTTDTLISSEGVIGSPYNDAITGSIAANRLEGRGGNDLMLGGAGADTLTGGAGNDTLDGGEQRFIADFANISSQFDVAIYSDATGGVVVALGVDGRSGSASGPGVGTDVLIDIEFVVGSAYADVISGSNRSVPELIRGGAGNDTLSGGAGGTDLGSNLVDYSTAPSAVTVNLATGVATGGDGTDTLAGFQNVVSSSYNDVLIGDVADNFFDDRGGDDTYIGGAGNDRVSYNNVSGPVTVDLGANTTGGAAGSDTLVSIEWLRGSEYGDSLTGDGQANDIMGRAGNDAIATLGGDDIVHGGYGNDIIDGGPGNDTARFTGNLTDYSIDLLNGSYRLVDKIGARDGEDQVSGVELFEFADGTHATDALALNKVSFGTSSADSLRGSTGNDRLDGGAGLDSAIYALPRAQFEVRKIGSDILVAGPEGIDTLVSVERAIFADRAVGFDVDGTGGQAYRLYQAAFDRTPDLAGVGFWMDAIDRGFSLVDAAANFMNSPEFRTLYGANPSNADFMDLLYRNVMNRAPDTGYFFWLDALDGKGQFLGNPFSKAAVLAQFSESAENQANVIGVISNGFEYLPYTAV